MTTSDDSPQDNSNPNKGLKRSRRQQQRCRIQKTKIERERTESLIWWKVGRYKHQLAQIDCAIEKETRTNFGFIPDINISVNLNARIVLGNTTTEEYFNHVTNKRFHDLTTGNLIPTAAASILGYGLKFIPVPKQSILQDNINKAMRRFTRNAYLKVFFSDKDIDDDDDIEPFRVIRKWMPTEVPHSISR